MSVLDKKLIHDRRLFAQEGISKEMGQRVLEDLASRQEIAPETSPSGRTYLSPREAERFHAELHAA